MGRALLALVGSWQALFSADFYHGGEMLDDIVWRINKTSAHSAPDLISGPVVVLLTRKGFTARHD